MFGFNFFSDKQENQYDREQAIRDTSDGSLTRQKIKEIVSQAVTCHLCGESLGSDRTLDHICALKNGGTHTSDNVDVAHRSCNSKKGAKELYLFPRRLRPDEE